MLLINCQVNLDLTQSRDCLITNSTGAGIFAITETKLYILVVTLSTQDNVKLLQQLKSGFKRIIKKYEHETINKSIPLFTDNIRPFNIFAIKNYLIFENL